MPAVSDPDRLVLIPAWNEEATVADVVVAARSLLGCEVLVIDDGSSDGTARVARTAGAMVVSHPFNLGVGAAIRTGMRVAVGPGPPPRRAAGRRRSARDRRREAVAGPGRVRRGRPGGRLTLRCRQLGVPRVADARGTMMRLLVEDRLASDRRRRRRHDQRVPRVRSRSARAVPPQLPDPVPVRHRRGAAARRRCRPSHRGRAGDDAPAPGRCARRRGGSAARCG